MDGAFVVLGRVGRAHGIHGEMRVAPYNAGSSLLLELRTWTIAGKTHQVRSVRAAGDVLIVALEGISTREGAETLRGAEVSVPRSALPAAAEDEVYVADLVGCACFEGEVALGRVTAVATYPASTCFVIESEEGTREVPAVAPYFAGFDSVGRRIEIAHASDFPVERPRGKKPDRTP